MCCISFVVDLLLCSTFNIFQVLDNKEELKTKLKEILREKSDAFNSDQPEEDKVRDQRSIIVLIFAYN